jgi:hypothetical protein
MITVINHTYRERSLPKPMPTGLERAVSELPLLPPASPPTTSTDDTDPSKIVNRCPILVAAAFGTYQRISCPIDTCNLDRFDIRCRSSIDHSVVSHCDRSIHRRTSSSDIDTCCSRIEDTDFQRTMNTIDRATRTDSPGSSSIRPEIVPRLMD